MPGLQPDQGRGPGHNGKNGGLFLKAAGFVDDLRRRLPRRKFGSLAENNTMRKEDVQIVTDELDCRPILVCATRPSADDFDLAGRPQVPPGNRFRQKVHAVLHHTDMLNAYRQWPVRRPEHCATFLPAAAGSSHALDAHGHVLWGGRLRLEL